MKKTLTLAEYQEIKNAARDTGEIFSLLTLIIGSIENDERLNDGENLYDNSLKAVRALIHKTHFSLTEMTGVENE